MRSMIHILGAVGILVASGSHWGFAADPAQPYAGKETRAIKALSAVEVRNLLEGNGMGMALSAELNHYPGPRHVIDLAAELSLTARQKHLAEAEFESMNREAKRLGAIIVRLEKELDAEFGSGNASVERVDGLTREIGAHMGRLRATHLKAHLAVREALGKDQIALYDRLRGYSGMGGNGHHPHGGHHH